MLYGPSLVRGAVNLFELLLFAGLLAAGFMSGARVAKESGVVLGAIAGVLVVCALIGAYAVFLKLLPSRDGAK